MFLSGLRLGVCAGSIVSSPLTIGMNFSDTENLEEHWATITNMDAIEVVQQPSAPACHQAVV